MKRIALHLTTATLILSLAACGSSTPEVKPNGEGTPATANGADPVNGGTANDPDARRTRPVDATVKRVTEVKEPVYLMGIDKQAQDSFREGIEIIAGDRPDYKAAEQKFQQATTQDPKFHEAFFNWGMVLERTGRSDEALQVYQKALAANPEDASANAYIAKIYLAKARAAQNFGNEAEATQWSGKAKALLEGLIAKNAANVAVNNAMALYWLGENDLDTSERYVKEVLYVQPRNVTGLNTRGLINLKRGNLLVAKWIFENKVLQYDPTSTEALTNLGYTYIKLDLRPLAMRRFKQALEADPENMETRMNIAALLLEHLDYAGALEHYEKVLVAQPNNLEAKSGRCDSKYGLTGTATAENRDASLTDAIGCYDGYLKEKPNEVHLYQRIAQTYQNKLENLEKAVEYYKVYGTKATLSTEDAEKHQKMIAQLEHIIASGGLKAMMEKQMEEMNEEDDGTEDGGGEEF
ncbi:MAG: tetratricopeptide (TPR) repeat protein [Myxococcota bacterium]|jgi:tetratricopeptide (TPR) repeat protein